MSWLGGARARLRSWLGRAAADARSDEEIRLHVELETEHHVRRGLTRREARRRALLAFGGVEQHRADLRAGRRVPYVEDAWQDVRIGARSLRRAPGFTALAVLILALGIGAGTAVFSVLHGVLLSELPVRDPARVAVVWQSAPARAADRLPLLHDDVREFGEASLAAREVAGVSYYGATERVLVDEGRARAVSGTWVTGNFFATLGVVPALGRLLRDADDAPGAAGAMVIGHSLWQHQFGGSAAAIGRSVEWNGRRYEVVGVAPRGFEYPAGAELWLPALPDFPATLDPRAAASEIMVFDLVVRLAAGAGVAQMREELASFLRAGDAVRPEALRDLVPVAAPLHEQIVGDVRPPLSIAMAAVALLLLIACVNVANLLLIRGSARVQELAIRSSLGAGRARLLRQLLTESALLAAAACVLGVALAYGAIEWLLPLAPAELPRLGMVGLNAAVLAFALGVALLTVLLAGLLPALVAARGSASAWLRGGGRTVGTGRGVRTFRAGLVVAQVALAVVVMAGAGLLLRSLAALQRADLGFEPERLLVLQTAFPPALLPERGERLLLKEAMLQRVGALPGVVSAAALPSKPFAAQGGWSALYSADGQPAAEQAGNPWVSLEVVGPAYFATLGVPLRTGRVFGDHDRDGAERVAIVSEAVARHTWPGGDAVGRRIKLGSPEGPGEWHTVVGIAGDTRYRELAEPQPSVYLPIRQFGGPVPLNLAVRTTTDEAAAIVPAIRRALGEVHPALLLVSGATMPALMATPLARPRFTTALITALAAITLLLATVGLYGAMAATVRQRTRELGVRLALGAQAAHVRTLVLRHALGITLLGCALGIATALAGTRVLHSMLFGVAPTDAITFLAVPALFLAGAGLACSVPAWRAGRVDPARTLRDE
jgi:putative ABC transport system permease protein